MEGKKGLSRYKSYIIKPLWAPKTYFFQQAFWKLAGSESNRILCSEQVICLHLSSNVLTASTHVSISLGLMQKRKKRTPKLTLQQKS